MLNVIVHNVMLYARLNSSACIFCMTCVANHSICPPSLLLLLLTFTHRFGKRVSERCFKLESTSNVVATIKNSFELDPVATKVLVLIQLADAYDLAHCRLSDCSSVKVDPTSLQLQGYNDEYCFFSTDPARLPSDPKICKAVVQRDYLRYTSRKVAPGKSDYYRFKVEELLENGGTSRGWDVDDPTNPTKMIEFSGPGSGSTSPSAASNVMVIEADHNKDGESSNKRRYAETGKAINPSQESYRELQKQKIDPGFTMRDRNNHRIRTFISKEQAKLENDPKQQNLRRRQISFIKKDNQCTVPGCAYRSEDINLSSALECQHVGGLLGVVIKKSNGDSVMVIEPKNANISDLPKLNNALFLDRLAREYPLTIHTCSNHHKLIDNHLRIHHEPRSRPSAQIVGQPVYENRTETYKIVCDSRGR